MNNLYDELIEQLEKNHESPESQAETAIMVYQAAAAEMDRFKEIQKRAKVLLEDYMEYTEQTKVRNGAGQAYFTKDSVSVRYDTKALDALCQSHDDLALVLWPHRKESKRKGSLTIKG